jgi:hypothetical protein
MPPSLCLVYQSQVLPLGDHDVTIGRLPECDLVLDGPEVSRRHARIVRTPDGPLLGDRSRYGTLVNGSRLAGPVLLAAGDVLQVGSHRLSVEVAPADLAARHPANRFGRRLARWRRRYGLAELIGGAAAVAAGLVLLRWTGHLAVAAVGASLAEAAAFRLALLARESGREGFSRTPLLEFGAADAVDALALRPAAFALGLRLLGGVPGILAGKLLADALFYGPVLSLWHWRRGAAPPDPQEVLRRRPTTSVLPPPSRP